MSFGDRFKKIEISLIHRKEQLTLTALGWKVILLSTIALVVLTVNQIHPFLSLNSPVSADILVVEGWLPDYAIKSSIDEFKKGCYRKLITTGGPLSKGYYLAEYKTFAEIAAATLIALNFEPDNLIAVPAPEAIKHRTQASAVALRQWLSTSDLEVKAINLYTFGPHARRSWLIFKQVLAPDIRVGVIAAQPLDYDAKNWWQSSAGVRSIMSESIAYVYARFIDWRD